MKIILNENKKNEEIDSSLFNFLIRRLKKEKRKLGGDFGNFEPIEVIEYTFEGVPGFGFNSFYNSKKDIENNIFRMLVETDVIDFWPYDLDERDPKRVKIVKTVRNFINFILK